MAEHSTIEWTGATWNPITGCSVLSPGCKHCYAMGLAGTRLRNHPSRIGLTQDTKAGPVWTGEVRLNKAWLDQPLQWKRPREIFVCAHSDLFHEDVPDAWIDQVFARMALAGWHTFQVLTKRSPRMRAYLSSPDTVWRIANAMIDAAPVGLTLKNPIILSPGKPLAIERRPLPNVWLGVSVEDELRAIRVLDLLEAPAAVRWVSYEPALTYVDFRSICQGNYFVDALRGLKYHDAPEDGPPGATEACARIDQVVMGGESGPNARPMHPTWVRWTQRDCEEAGTPFLFKQWGAWAPCASDGGDWPVEADGFIRLAIDGERRPDGWPMQRVGKKAAGRLLDGVLHDARPVVRP